MLESFVPSIIIAASAVGAFAAGRLIGWLAARTRLLRSVRIVVVALSIGVALFFHFSRSSRYALLLPVSFAIGCFTHGRRPIAPGVFD